MTPARWGETSLRTLKPRRSKKADSITKFAVPFPATMLHMLTKNQVEGHERSVGNDVRVALCFADSNQNLGFTGNTATGAVFKLGLIFYLKQRRISRISITKLSHRILQSLKFNKKIKIVNNFFSANVLYSKLKCKKKHNIY